MARGTQRYSSCAIIVTMDLMKSTLSLQNVTKLYRNGRGITDVSLSVAPGESFGFLGPNGAGKTTTIRCIMNFIRPQHGMIKILDKSIRESSAGQHNFVGFIPAEPQLYPDWTGNEHVRFYQSLRGQNDVSELMKMLGLPMDVKFHELSTGNKQKLAILLAFVGNNKLLVMDEPTKGLDPLLQQIIYELLRRYKEGGGSIFVSSHNLPEVEKICDRVGVIKEGRIVANQTMQELRSLSVHLVTILSTKPINVDSLANAATEVLHHKGNHILLKVHGDINPLLQTLSKHQLKDVEISHANLEESFMEYYK